MGLEVNCLRFYASAIFGLTQYYQAYPHNDLKDNIEKLADSLVQNYQDQVKDDWHWFEPSLTYDNARLPQALFEAYKLLANKNT